MPPLQYDMAISPIKRIESASPSLGIWAGFATGLDQGKEARVVWHEVWSVGSRRPQGFLFNSLGTQSSCKDLSRLRNDKKHCDERC